MELNIPIVDVDVINYVFQDGGTIFFNCTNHLS